ncbi:hypothetical protein HN371_24755 [Candidatus Poribacteria bacterium]|jgi:hypothetical protein|nr:hypothetical protein [Candidatus Poribacteria bacterium]MBT5533513.1 hypothetical protein [Candidatus Poribacteria bacterium]MBT5714229.1 hypothetical protein [Candidatus Poribacteria bacterium]MBT7807216.1 hypothetical protein [Candidatus Poribacteria bacterium]
MGKPYVFIAFDTEDSVNPAADDALLNLARVFDEASLPASFFMVGEKARVLRDRGRRDVIESLRPHEIAYHGNHWLEFPEPALVYGNRDPWETAVGKAVEYEAPGVRDVAEITGRFPVAFCQHDANHSPATTHALRQSGIRVWNGGLGGPLEGIGWIMDMLVVGRNSRAVSLQGSWSGVDIDPDEPDRAPETMIPDDELRAFQQRFDAQLERGDSHIVLLGHPTCWAMTQWFGWYDWPFELRHPDAARTPTPFPRGRRWEPTPSRSPADMAAHLEWTTKAAKWLAGRNDIRTATFSDVWDHHAEEPGSWLDEQQVRSVARQLCRSFDYVTEAGRRSPPRTRCSSSRSMRTSC